MGSNKEGLSEETQKGEEASPHEVSVHTFCKPCYDSLSSTGFCWCDLHLLKLKLKFVSDRRPITTKHMLPLLSASRTVRIRNLSDSRSEDSKPLLWPPYRCPSVDT
eukprot:4713101-Amphidinium_carterae.1